MPDLALSVRQPWAWAIIHAGKDIENRTTFAVNKGLKRLGPVAIHASKGMTREEYADAADFMAGIGVTCPPPAALLRGGIIGSVEVTAIVKTAISPWFMGPRGLVLKDQEPHIFIPVVGMLGYFRWKEADQSIVPPPAKWMLPASPAPRAETMPAASIQEELL